MLKSKSKLKSLSILAPGFLAFMGYYEILSGLRLPLNFTVNRVTHTYRFQSPLLGGLELDLLAYVIAVSYIAYIEDKRRHRLLHIIIAIVTVSTLILSLFFGLTFLAYIALGSASLFSTILHVRGRGFISLPQGLLVSILFTEIAALVAVATYYILGSWIPIIFHIALRERLIWAPLEWGSIPLFIFIMLSSFTRVVLGRPLIKPLKTGITEPSKERGGFKLLIVLALSLTVFLVVLPHLPSVNPEFKPISEDTSSYGAFFEDAESSGLTQALSKIAGRPVYLFFLYHVWLASARNTVLLMDIFHPIAALTLLTAASFYAGWKHRGGRGSGYNAILVPLGYALPAFVAGGFQANSLALTTATLALVVDPDNRTRLAGLTLLMTLTALIHPWTHLMYAAALVAYSFRDRRRLLCSLSAVTVSYAISHIVNYQFGGAINVSAETAGPLFMNLGFYLVGSWFDAFQLWLWNTLSNPVYLLTAVLADDMITFSVMCVAAPLMFILPANLVCRLVLNIPLQLQVSKTAEVFPKRYQALMFLILFVRVLGNLSGLTPLEV